MSFFDQLQQASFAGQPFGVLSGDAQVGRRLAVHEYPFRDAPWVEDLGRATRWIRLVGFLLEGDAIYGGDDVIAQRDRMLAAAEALGPSALVHPTLGRLTVNVAELSIAEKWDAGRYFELAFTFVEHGQRLFPSIGVATGAASLADAISADVAAVLTFVAALNRVLLWPSEMIKTIVATIGFWTSLAQNLVDDATRLYNMPSTLQGAFGRFFGGATRRQTGSSPTSVSAPATVASLIASGTATRAGVTSSIGALVLAGNTLTRATAPALAGAAQNVAAAVLAATADPADAIRLLAQLAGYTPSAPAMSSVVGQAMATGQSAAGDLFRRAAVAAIARAASTYQPSSADDAVAVRNTVTALIDAEITVAGNQGEDSIYNALRALRASVVKDLNARGASLPAMQTVSVAGVLPAPVLAQRLYRDGMRSDELVADANPPHPAFMPATFRALAN